MTHKIDKPMVNPFDQIIETEDEIKGASSSSFSPFDPDPFGKSPEDNSTAKQTALLTSVSADIELYFPLAVTKISQEFINNTSDNIEGIYQFPLPKESGFIAFKTLLNGKEYIGEIKARTQAEEAYEEAVSNGDTSIMVEKVSDGMYQINVGNLAPNDNVKFELTLATLLELTPSSARYFLPTVITPRYGISHLDPFNTPQTNFLAEYNFSGTLNVGDDLSAQRLQTSFNLNESSTGNYEFSGHLDHDLVVNIALPLNQQATALYAVHKEHEYNALTTIPSKQALAVQNANLQLLVDCSGSMTGNSISQAKKGMESLFDLFNEDDHINLTRFGSRFEQVLTQWQPFSGKSKSTLRRSISELSADLGGTELLKALEATLNNAKSQKQSDVLLLTDGQVWDDKDKITELTELAIKVNCRISVIGLGNAVNESFLLNLAEQTGGFATLVNPNEKIAEKLVTLLAQIKSSRGEQKFTQVPHSTWQKLPTTFINQMPSIGYFMGQEVPVNALISTQYSDVNATANKAECVQEITWQEVTGMQAKALTAITVMQRIYEEDTEVQAQLAEQYQQISEHTSFIMVADREEKQTAMPKLQHVPQMQVDMQSSFMASSVEEPNFPHRNSPIPAVRKLKATRKRPIKEVDQFSSCEDYDLDAPVFDTPILQPEIDFIPSTTSICESKSDIRHFLYQLSTYLTDNNKVPDVNALMTLSIPLSLSTLIIDFSDEAEGSELLSVIAYILTIYNRENGLLLSEENIKLLNSFVSNQSITEHNKVLINNQLSI